MESAKLYISSCIGRNAVAFENRAGINIAGTRTGIAAPLLKKPEYHVVIAKMLLIALIQFPRELKLRIICGNQNFAEFQDFQNSRISELKLRHI